MRTQQEDPYNQWKYLNAVAVSSLPTYDWNAVRIVPLGSRLTAIFLRVDWIVK